MDSEYFARYSIQSFLALQALHFVARFVADLRCLLGFLGLGFQSFRSVLLIRFANFVLTGFLDSHLLDFRLALTLVLQGVVR